ncbi:hypothetical protein ACFLU1_05635 [Chloroflexota bacterium]
MQKLLHITFLFITKLWTLIPALITDPFDVIERVGKLINPNFSLSAPNWIFWVLLIIGLLFAGYLTYRDLKKESKEIDYLNDIKVDLITLNKQERGVATKKAQQNIAPGKKSKIKADVKEFIMTKGLDLFTGIEALLIKEQIVDRLIQFFTGIADVFDANGVGIKLDLNAITEYTDAKEDIAKKQLKLNKNKRIMIQTHIRKVNNLTYGLNNVIMFRHMYRSSPDFQKSIPLQYNLMLEGLEREGDKFLNEMLNNLDKDWEKVIKIDYNEV